MEEIKVGEYVSRKEYLKKYDSNVGYALYIQNNIKKDDYVRLNTGEIVKVIGIKENNVNKKAIYFGIYDTDWFDSSAVENFSANIIDLIEVGDYVNGYRILEKTKIKNNEMQICILKDNNCSNWRTVNDKTLKSIVTKEQFANMEYRLED